MIRFKTIVGSLILFICICSLNGCTRNDNAQLVKDYYNQLNQSNYSELSEFIGDSITISEGDYNMNYSTNDYYQFFQWDSVFNPKYEILAIKEIDNKVEISICKTCTRIEFLNQKPLISTEIIEIKNQKISKIKNIEMDSDFKLWNIKRGQMVTWIKKNHPELDGFIYDQTKIGAQNYLKAITLYKKSNN
ncbi:hypothetical protein D1815_19175 [Aquimarina sp. AD1]|uniref:hypothetical protein n=1 Tax=Aquimarina sp. (strain AD1) TaxID=1714848 RepID=UPI000E50C226|nr:hypothetical protein [Aquimarina sp. AD1]AXT57772.1 hypothetical protein D1815_19175 [Aquimarina sp. AD1]RKN17453.1 hypothetical protein D7035_14990 [Aquimarina sp. AD1]